MLATMLKGAFSARKLEITNTANLTSTLNLSTYTYTNASLGDESATRHIVVAGVTGQSAPDVSSVTIAGITATMVIEETRSAGNAFICFAKVPTGTTGTIVISMSAGQDRQAISVFAVTGSQTIAALDSFASLDLNSSQSINTSKYGVLIGIRYAGSLATEMTMTWTDSVTGGSGTLESSMLWMSAYSATTSTSETVTWTENASPSNRVLVAASFEPI